MKRNHYSEATWQQTKQDFCSGNLTLREAAEKHGVNFKTVESRARREGWKRCLNEDLQIVKDVAAKIIQSRSVELGQQSAEFLAESCHQLRTLMKDFKARHGQAATLADFERYVATFAQLVRTGRELYGLDCDTEQHPKPLVQVQCVGSVNVSGAQIADEKWVELPDLSELDE